MSASKGLTSGQFRRIIQNNPVMKLIYEKGSAFDMELREVTEKLNKAEEQVRQTKEQVRQTKAQITTTVRNLIGMGFSDEEIFNITGFPSDAIALIRLEIGT